MEKMTYITILQLLLLVKVTFQTGIAIGNLATTFKTNILQKWVYSSKVNSLEKLKLNEESVRQGVANDGHLTRRAIERMVNKALSGQPVKVLVLGGSTTIGADLGPNNLRLTYHCALADWWNKTIGSLNGSYMHRQIVAVGGVGTTYFGHCWEEYVNKTDTFDFITWEFAINDPDSLEYDKAVERFTRDVLSMTSKPGLSFINFFSRGSFPRGKTQKCKRDLDKAAVVDSIANRYSSTSISWERAICKYRASNPSEIEANDVFVNHHPNMLGHAHAAYILIKYFSTVFQDLSAKEKVSQRFFRNIYPAYNSYYTSNVVPQDTAYYRSKERLPNPMFMTTDEVDKIAVCWTGIKSDYRASVPHNIFHLTVLQNEGFTTLSKGNWETEEENRDDITGGYITMKKNKVLKLQFTVPNNAVNQESVLSVAIRNKYFGGKVKFSSNERNEKIIDTSEKKRAGTAVNELWKVNPGTHVLTIRTWTGGCHLCAIIID